MKEQNPHINLSEIEEQSRAFFSNGTFQWKESSDEVWEKMLPELSEKNTRIVFLRSKSFSFAIAALFILLVGLGGFFRFYSKTIYVPSGKHQIVELPDGSSIQLNAQSRISYKPYWWKFNRSVQFEGEAFFKVQKGEAFSVISNRGITEVLGTSFNIFSREETYKVTCVTGRVKVISETKKEVILSPDSRATILLGGKIELEENISTMPDISWKDNYFQFTAVPFEQVIDEIERQYNLKIVIDTPVTGKYTGNFKRDDNVENVLEYVCLPMGLKFEQVSGDTYLIHRDANE
ncbi:MAG: FecR family protein [Prolixibacteraceae bacterium]|nr:FecR family protein [Prolixibacteraceae bacterium]